MIKIKGNYILSWYKRETTVGWSEDDRYQFIIENEIVDGYNTFTKYELKSIVDGYNTFTKYELKSEMLKHLPNTLSCGEWVSREYLDKDSHYNNKYYIGTYDTLEDIHNDYLRIEQACKKLSILFELEK